MDLKSGQKDIYRGEKMENNERKILLKQLSERIILERKKENLYNKSQISKTVVKYNPEFLTENEKQQLLGLKAFIENNPDLSEKDLKEILNSNKRKYQFLLECERKFRNFFEDVRYHIAVLFDKIANERSFEKAMNRPLKW